MLLPDIYSAGISRSIISPQLSQAISVFYDFFLREFKIAFYFMNLSNDSSMLLIEILFHNNYTILSLSPF